MFPTLHYTDTRGKPRVWSIRTEQDNNGDYRILTETGQVGGKMRITSRKVTVGKRPVDPQKKAHDEAQSKWNDKKQEIWCKERYKVMLAEQFRDQKTIPYPVLVQPKLDGCRALAYRLEDDVFLISRTGLKKANPLTHIKEALRPLLKPDGSEYLDGELYCHGMARETITGICNKKKIDKTYATRSLRIQFHVFDLVDCNEPNEPVEKRQQRLVARLSADESNTTSPVRLVPTLEATSEQDMIHQHTEWVRAGYEGTMIRIKGTPYENKRSKFLLKYKDSEDEEFEICGYHEGKGDWEGAVIWECWYDKEKNLKFSVKQDGSVEKLRALRKDADKYIGKLLTVKFQSRMKNGCPEFGVGIELDRQDL